MNDWDMLKVIYNQSFQKYCHLLMTFLYIFEAYLFN